MSRLVEIAAGVLVCTSTLFLTTTTVVLCDSGCILIDPAATAEELASLSAELRRRGLTVQLGVATHAHWDHLLWSRSLGRAPRYATGRAVAQLSLGRASLLAETEHWAPGHDLELFARVVALPPGEESLPSPGGTGLVLGHDGHAPGHLALFFPEHGVLVAGDMCSDAEVPLLDLAAADPLGDYRRGLELLAGVAGVRHLVPGHGTVTDASGLRRRVDADRRYLDALESGMPVEDPRLADPSMRAEHERQLLAIRRAEG